MWCGLLGCVPIPWHIFMVFFAWEHRGDPLVSLFSTEERLWNMSANQKKFRFFLLRLSPERLNLDLPPSLFPRN